MCLSIILVPFFGTLPSWLHLPLSGLVGISILSGLIAVATKLDGWSLQRALSAEHESKNTETKSITTNGSSNISTKKVYSKGTVVRRAAALILISTASCFFLTREAYKSRGQCSPSGDFFHSDHFTIDTRQGPQMEIVNKFGKKQIIHLCPPSAGMDWKPGVQIKEAWYEWREGSCMDFSSGESWFSAERDQGGNYVLAKGYE